jgi:small subunit ribosomal protein S20
MAITKSAKKAIRSSEKKAVFNLRRKRAFQSVEKDIEKLVKEGKIAEAEKLVPQVYKTIDKAAKMRTIDKNTASRKKSRIVASIVRAKNAKK